MCFCELMTTNKDKFSSIIQKNTKNFYVGDHWVFLFNFVK